MNIRKHWQEIGLAILIVILAYVGVFRPMQVTRSVDRSVDIDRRFDTSIVDLGGTELGDVNSTTTTVTVNKTPNFTEEQLALMAEGLYSVFDSIANMNQALAERTTAETGAIDRLAGVKEKLFEAEANQANAVATATVLEGYARQQEAAAQAQYVQAQTAQVTLDSCIDLYNTARATGFASLFEVKPSERNLRRVFGEDFQGCFPILQQAGYNWD